ncbi:MAG: hypothetical protein [Siphoviridae sp. ctCJE6]|nr:MAG: hypothetical protein [Siphoviridae sp. ctCJE6]
MAPDELALVVLLGVGFLGCGVWVWRRTGYWHLLAVFGTFFACFGFWEWHAKNQTDLTVSSQVGVFGVGIPDWQWYTFLGILQIGWLALGVHFDFMRRKRREKQK